jgi:uncharacterized membrane protein HdeD (DUF308 family)
VSPALRILTGILGVVGILVGLFILAVASFADGTTGERVVTIAIAAAIVIVGATLLRFAFSRRPE